jgi:hypothetical protein
VADAPERLRSLKRTGSILKPSNSRVVIRPFEVSSENRIEKIIARVSSLSEREIEYLLKDVMREFSARHQRIREFFLHRFEPVQRHLPTDQPINENRRLLIGSFFTQEYALESAALFNPSMVWHPDQTGLPAGCSRFVLSFRAIGEGHISSIAFRSGVIDAEHRIRSSTRFTRRKWDRFERRSFNIETRRRGVIPEDCNDREFAEC